MLAEYCADHLTALGSRVWTGQRGRWPQPAPKTVACRSTDVSRLYANPAAADPVWVQVLFKLCSRGTRVARTPGGISPRTAVLPASAPPTPSGALLLSVAQLKCGRDAKEVNEQCGSGQRSDSCQTLLLRSLMSCSCLNWNKPDLPTISKLQVVCFREISYAGCGQQGRKCSLSQR